MTPKLDRNGNIIRTRKSDEEITPVVTPPTKKIPVEEVPVDSPEEEPLEIATSPIPPEPERLQRMPQPQQPVQQPQGVSILYDFTIHCATVSLAGMDVRYVCANCPFRKTECRDLILLPTESQMMDIARILMMDDGAEESVGE